ALVGMKSYYSKFLNAFLKVLKASKDLKLHMQLKNLNDKDLKVEFKDMKLKLTSIFSMEMDFKLDIQYLYEKYPTKKRNIKNLKDLFTFYFVNFGLIIRYVFFFEYQNYCSRYGYFSEVQVYNPSPSSINPINPGRVIEPYYHMSIVAIFSYSKYYNRDLQTIITKNFGLNIHQKVKEKLKNDFTSTRNEILDFIRQGNAFLKSKNNQVDILLTDAEFEDDENLSHFLHESLVNILKQISDEHTELKKHLSKHFNSLPIFFKEVQVGLNFLHLNHIKEDMITKSYSSKKMNFELRLQEKDVLFVEWGPVLNFNLFKEALESSNENENPLLENFSLIMKEFPTFQRNYIKK
ncbi:hypothetical protein HMI55_004953, partial [Coelomomyces lativittatus]